MSLNGCFSLHYVLGLQEFLAPEIISHFVMHGTNVGEIVKHLISLLKKKDDDISYIFLEALKRVSDKLIGDKIGLFLYFLPILSNYLRVQLLSWYDNLISG